jgi:hypothetical protein
MSATAATRDHRRCPHTEASVPRIRVRIAELPGVMRDLVENIVSAQADMRIVDDDHGGPADVVVVGVPTLADAATLTARLYAYPRQRILALALDGRHGASYELRPHITALAALSPDGIVAAIRAGLPAGSV